MDERLMIAQLQREVGEANRRIRRLSDEVDRLRLAETSRDAEFEAVVRSVETMAQAVDQLTLQGLAPLIAVIERLSEDGPQRAELIDQIDSISTEMHPNAGSVAGAFSVALVQLLMNRSAKLSGLPRPPGSA